MTYIVENKWPAWSKWKLVKKVADLESAKKIKHKFEILNSGVFRIRKVD